MDAITFMLHYALHESSNNDPLPTLEGRGFTLGVSIVTPSTGVTESHSCSGPHYMLGYTFMPYWTLHGGKHIHAHSNIICDVEHS